MVKHDMSAVALGLVETLVNVKGKP